MPSDKPLRALETPSLLHKMRSDWDERARENARHYVATAQTNWSDDSYFDSGRLSVFHEILTDLGNVCHQTNAKQMSVLEIGCGSGRMTRALSEVFGEVYAVDVSGEMIRQAKESLRDRENIQLFQNNGQDLTVLGDVQVDFAFSCIVFQHIPSREVIHSYVREAARLLKPGALFKCQLQGDTTMDPTVPDDTWLGVPFSEADAKHMAEDCGFELRYTTGVGTQYFWLWLFRH
jgi:SAM-dependent methyltransferase